MSVLHLYNMCCRQLAPFTASLFVSTTKNPLTMFTLSLSSRTQSKRPTKHSLEGRTDVPVTNVYEVRSSRIKMFEVTAWLKDVPVFVASAFIPQTVINLIIDASYINYSYWYYVMPISATCLMSALFFVSGVRVKRLDLSRQNGMLYLELKNKTYQVPVGWCTHFTDNSVKIVDKTFVLSPALGRINPTGKRQLESMLSNVKLMAKSQKSKGMHLDILYVTRDQHFVWSRIFYYLLISGSFLFYGYRKYGYVDIFVLIRLIPTYNEDEAPDSFLRVPINN